MVYEVGLLSLSFVGVVWFFRFLCCFVLILFAGLGFGYG